jgi:DNA-binding beta-propeller fold protein YncE
LLALLLLTGCASDSRQPPRPNGVAVAPDGSVYVMDLGNHRVAHLSPDGRLRGAFGKLGTGPNEIYEGWGMALDQAGNIYLCDRRVDAENYTDYESVKVFSPNGRLVRELVTPGDSGRDGCYSVDVVPQGRVYVSYGRANQLRIFDAQGELLSTFWGKTGSGSGEFDGLNDVAVDGQRGLLYATDETNSRIQQFDLDVSPSGQVTLTHRLTFGSYGSAPGQLAYPQYLAVNEATGHLYVGDMANRRIQVFDTDGRFVREFAPQDVSDWQVLGLTIGPDGVVYAADALNSAVWVFEPDGRVRNKIEVAS